MSRKRKTCQDRHAHQCTQPDQRHRHRSKEGATTSHVRVDIGNGQIITSAITNEAVDELGITERDRVTVVVKASDVMIGVGN
jgi:molybdopterin-binding protein